METWQSKIGKALYAFSHLAACVVSLNVAIDAIQPFHWASTFNSAYTAYISANAAYISVYPAYYNSVFRWQIMHWVWTKQDFNWDRLTIQTFINVQRNNIYVHWQRQSIQKHLQTFTDIQRSKVCVHTLAMPRPISSLLRLLHHFPKKAILFSII